MIKRGRAVIFALVAFGLCGGARAGELRGTLRSDGGTSVVAFRLLEVKGEVKFLQFDWKPETVSYDPFVFAQGRMEFEGREGFRAENIVNGRQTLTHSWRVFGIRSEPVNSRYGEMFGVGRTVIRESQLVAWDDFEDYFFVGDGTPRVLLEETITPGTNARASRSRGVTELYLTPREGGTSFRGGFNLSNEGARRPSWYKVEITRLSEGRYAADVSVHHGTFVSDTTVAVTVKVSGILRGRLD